MTLFEGAEAGPVPTALVARTVKVYMTPLVSPETTWLRPVVPAWVSTPPAGFANTVLTGHHRAAIERGAAKLTVAF